MDTEHKNAVKVMETKRKYVMMQEVEVLKTIQELICSFFSEEQFTLSLNKNVLTYPDTPVILILI